MNRRRMMMGDSMLKITIDFGEEASSETYIEYSGKQYRVGTFKCKKGETITCVCASSAPRAPVAILLDGAVKAQGTGSTSFEFAVMSNLLITVTGGDNTKMEIAAEK